MFLNIFYFWFNWIIRILGSKKLTTTGIILQMIGSPGRMIHREIITPGRLWKFEYSNSAKTEIENILTIRVIGPGRFEWWKKGGRKSRGTVPLKWSADLHPAWPGVGVLLAEGLLPLVLQLAAGWVLLHLVQILESKVFSWFFRNLSCNFLENWGI